MPEDPIDSDAQKTYESLVVSGKLYSDPKKLAIVDEMIRHGMVRQTARDKALRAKEAANKKLAQGVQKEITDNVIERPDRVATSTPKVSNIGLATAPSDPGNDFLQGITKNEKTPSLGNVANIPGASSVKTTPKPSVRFTPKTLVGTVETSPSLPKQTNQAQARKVKNTPKTDIVGRPLDPVEAKKFNALKAEEEKKYLSEKAKREAIEAVDEANAQALSGIGGVVNKNQPPLLSTPEDRNASKTLQNAITGGDKAALYEEASPGLGKVISGEVQIPKGQDNLVKREIAKTSQQFADNKIQKQVEDLRYKGVTGVSNILSGNVNLALVPTQKGQQEAANLKKRGEDEFREYLDKAEQLALEGNDTLARAALENFAPAQIGLIGASLFGKLGGLAGTAIEPGGGTAVGTFVGSLGGGIGSGILASFAQDEAFKRILPPDLYQKWHQLRQTDSEVNPGEEIVGGTLPELIGGRPPTISEIQAMGEFVKEAKHVGGFVKAIKNQHLLSETAREGFGYLTDVTIEGGLQGGIPLAQDISRQIALTGTYDPSKTDWSNILGQTALGVITSRENHVADATAHLVDTAIDKVPGVKGMEERVQIAEYEKAIKAGLLKTPEMLAMESQFASMLNMPKEEITAYLAQNVAESTARQQALKQNPLNIDTKSGKVETGKDTLPIIKYLPSGRKVEVVSIPTTEKPYGEVKIEGDPDSKRIIALQPEEFSNLVNEHEKASPLDAYNIQNIAPAPVAPVQLPTGKAIVTPVFTAEVESPAKLPTPTSTVTTEPSKGIPVVSRKEITKKVAQKEIKTLANAEPLANPKDKPSLEKALQISQEEGGFGYTPEQATATATHVDNFVQAVSKITGKSSEEVYQTYSPRLIKGGAELVTAFQKTGMLDNPETGKPDSFGGVLIPADVQGVLAAGMNPDPTTGQHEFIHGIERAIRRIDPVAAQAIDRFLGFKGKTPTKQESNDLSEAWVEMILSARTGQIPAPPRMNSPLGKLKRLMYDVAGFFQRLDFSTGFPSIKSYVEAGVFNKSVTDVFDKFGISIEPDETLKGYHPSGRTLKEVEEIRAKMKAEKSKVDVQQSEEDSKFQKKQQLTPEPSDKNLSREDYANYFKGQKLPLDKFFDIALPDGELRFKVTDEADSRTLKIEYLSSPSWFKDSKGMPVSSVKSGYGTSLLGRTLDTIQAQYPDKPLKLQITAPNEAARGLLGKFERLGIISPAGNVAGMKSFPVYDVKTKAFDSLNGDTKFQKKKPRQKITKDSPLAQELEAAQNTPVTQELKNKARIYYPYAERLLLAGVKGEAFPLKMLKYYGDGYLPLSKAVDVLLREQHGTKVDRAVKQLQRATVTPALAAQGLLGDKPEYLDGILSFMMKQREKVLSGKLTARDLAKAYFMTVSSMRADAINPEIVKEKTGYEFTTPFVTRVVDEETGEITQEKIRPEEASAAWLGTPEGQKALNNIEQGKFDARDWLPGIEVRKAYGNDILEANGVFSTPEKNQFTMANLDSLVKEINDAKGDPTKIGIAVKKLKGIGNAKTEFVKHLLGFGESPTLDAVELNYWFTSFGDINKAQSLSRMANAALAANHVGDTKVYNVLKERITNRFAELQKSGVGSDFPPEYAGALLHHWLWDKAKGTYTTHEGMYEAMAKFQKKTMIDDSDTIESRISEAHTENGFASSALTRAIADNKKMTLGNSGGLTLEFGSKAHSGSTFEEALKSLNLGDTSSIENTARAYWDSEKNVANLYKDEERINIERLADVDSKVRKEQQSTREFKKFFYGSKIVDDKGNPLVVFHGTRTNFHEFNPAEIGKIDGGYYGKGFYFTPTLKVAHEYGPRVLPTYLSIKKPFIIDEDAEVEGLVKSLRKLPGSEEALAEYDDTEDYEPGYFNKKNVPDFVQFGIHPDTLSDLLKSSGYDGVIVKDGETTREIIAFEPNQIKSATDNVGSFSRYTDDIRFQTKLEKFGGRDIVNESDPVAVHKRIVSALLNTSKEKGEIPKTRELLGKVKDFLPDSELPKFVTNLPVYFEPTPHPQEASGLANSTIDENGNRIGRRIDLFSKAFKAKIAGRVFLHEVQHLVDYHILNDSTGEQNPRLHEFVQHMNRISDLNDKPLVAQFMGNQGIVRATETAKQILGEDVKPGQVGNLAKLVIRRAIDTYDSVYGEDDFSNKAWEKLDEIGGLDDDIRFQLRMDFGDERPSERRARLLKRTGQVAVDLLGIPRTLMTTADLSAPGRQGIILTASELFTNPKAVGNAFSDMFKAASPIGGKEATVKQWNAIKSSKYYELAKHSGLYLAQEAQERAELAGANDIEVQQAGEEAYASNLVSKHFFPGSERAYSGYLDKLRIETFEKWTDELKASGVDISNSKAELDAIAHYINIATGRGDIHSLLESAAPVLNATMFSPRFVASRFQFLNPVTYAKMPVLARKKALASAFKATGMFITALLLAKGAGEVWRRTHNEKENPVQVELDPDDSDFGKIQIGNARYEFSGGIVSNVRFLLQLGKRIGAVTNPYIAKDPAGAYTKQELSEEGTKLQNHLLKFVRGKASPVAGAVSDRFFPQLDMNQDVGDYEKAVSLFVPMVLGDIYKNYKAEGVKGVAETAIPNFFGIGTQLYDSTLNDKKRKLNNLKIQIKRLAVPPEERIKNEKLINEARKSIDPNALDNGIKSLEGDIDTYKKAIDSIPPKERNSRRIGEEVRKIRALQMKKTTLNLPKPSTDVNASLNEAFLDAVYA